MHNDQLTLSPISSPVGVGLRDLHLEFILKEKPDLGWFEILADNILSSSEGFLSKLENLRADYPFSLHSVGTSIGSTDGLDFEYLKKLKLLIERFEPTLVSEHLCWSGAHGVHLHELFPLPHNEETVNHVADRVSEIQEYLGRKISIENVSAYQTFDESTLEESEFITEIAKRSGSGILLDLNNIFINEANLNLCAKSYIKNIPANLVTEIHLAGGEQREDYILDSHNCPVWDEVWELYQIAMKKFGPVPTLIEWDNDLPEFDLLMEEANKAQAIIDSTCTSSISLSGGSDETHVI